MPGSVLGLTAYVYALKVLPTSTVGTYAFVNPIVAVVLGTLLLHERLTVQTIVAMAVILFGVGFILGPRRSVLASARAVRNKRAVSPSSGDGAW